MGEVFTKSFEVCVPSINTHHLNVFFLFRRQTTEKSIRTRSSLTLLKPEDFSGSAIYHACYELDAVPDLLSRLKKSWLSCRMQKSPVIEWITGDNVLLAFGKLHADDFVTAVHVNNLTSDAGGAVTS